MLRSLVRYSALKMEKRKIAKNRSYTMHRVALLSRTRPENTFKEVGEIRCSIAVAGYSVVCRWKWGDAYEEFHSQVKRALKNAYFCVSAFH